MIRVMPKAGMMQASMPSPMHTIQRQAVPRLVPLSPHSTDEDTLPSFRFLEGPGP
jgi:hypothetical protein